MKTGGKRKKSSKTKKTSTSSNPLELPNETVEINETPETALDETKSVSTNPIDLDADLSIRKFIYYHLSQIITNPFCQHQTVENDLAILPFGSTLSVQLSSNLRWDHRVNLIGEKCPSPNIHVCDKCDKPILIYGRMVSIHYLQAISTIFNYHYCFTDTL